MKNFSLVPFRRSKRVAVLVATLLLGGASGFASFPISPQSPILRDFAILPCSALFAQEEAPDWDALFERRDGWLAADGIYSVELGRDAASQAAAKVAPQAAPKSVKLDANSPVSPDPDVSAPRRTLFIFSDTFGGSTQNAGRDFDEIKMSNHSFAVLSGSAPEPSEIDFFWRRKAESKEFAPTKVKSEATQNAQNKQIGENSQSSEEKPERLAPRNPLGVDRWLQDGVVWRDRVWLSALLVGAGWKPERVDAVSLGLDANGSPDFNDVLIDETAPLSFRTETAQVVFGAAICDDADDGFLYVFGYLDRFDVGSRKDLVVARAPRASFGDFSTWRYFDGRAWSPNVADAARPEAGLVERVSTEFSVSKIPSGANAGRYLLLYTPGVIGNEIAFRVGDAPWGPFGPETVFYRSTVPRQFERGVRCYNAKAHPAFGDDEKILVSYNVNRLGTLPRRPAEYRPRFVWLRYSTVDAATGPRQENAK